MLTSPSLPAPTPSAPARAVTDPEALAAPLLTRLSETQVFPWTRRTGHDP